MEACAIYQAALHAIEALLATPLSSAGWNIQAETLTLEPCTGDLFADAALQENLTRALPTHFAITAPTLLPAAQFAPELDAQFLLLPATIAPTSLTLKGFIISLPSANTLTTHQQAGLESILQLSHSALKGIHSLAQSYRRQERLEAIATVGRDATAYLNPEELLEHVTHLISKHLGFYHVGIFLMDSEQQYAVLKATNSPEGRALLALHHKLKVGEQGIVGYVTGSGEPRITLEVGSDRQHFANPLLPATRAEITLPMRHRGQVIGALDVQSTQPDTFTQDDFTALQIMADQLTHALVNARLYKAAQRRLQDTHLLRELMLRASALTRRDVLTLAQAFLKDALPYPQQAFLCKKGDHLQPLEGSKWLSDSLPLTAAPWNTVWAGESYWNSPPPDMPEFTPPACTLAAVPIQERGETQLLFAVASPEEGTNRQYEVRFLEALATELGVLLQNARLYETISARAEMLQRLMQTGAHIAANREVNTILDWLIQAINAEIPGRLEIALLRDETRLEWITAAPDACTTSEANGLAAQLRGLTPHLIQPEARATLLEKLPQLGDYIMALPQQPLFFQPLQTPERVVGLLLLNIERLPKADMQERLAAVQILANQTALALANAQLVSRLCTQAEELTLAYEEAYQLNEIRTQMVQNVSHELRTPLGIILGYSEMLLEGALGDLAPPQRNIIYTIYARARSLNRLIHNLTTLQGHIELGPPTQVTLQHLVPQVIAEFEEMAERQHILFHLDIPDNLPTLSGDSELLHLALSHLIENAIKFSPDKGIVMIRALDDMDWVCLSVIDQGIGIASEHLQLIFERFYQVDGSTRRRYGGMGLGLSLVMEIVHAHGGSIEVASVPGVGSTFTLQLPLQQKPKPDETLTPCAPYTKSED